MLRIVQLHLGLFKYLRVELKKKRTSKVLVMFFKQLLLSYFRELLRLYKELFLLLDPDFKKQKQQYKNYQQIKVDLQRALKLLQYIDKNMVKMGKNRKERKQFWRDFYKSAQVRVDVLKELEKEIK